MGKTIRYAFITATLAYLAAAVLLTVFYLEQTGWSRIDNETGTFLISGLTLGLSELKWWGHFYPLAVLVPWLGSTLVLALLVRYLDGSVPRRRIFGGVSISVYYLANWLSLIIEELVKYGGTIQSDMGYSGYLTLFIWPAAGFGLGYLAAMIAGKIVPGQVPD
ncbi:MAG: hypothetical protein ABID71_05675 [Chloroflexota bacterium]